MNDRKAVLLNLLARYGVDLWHRRWFHATAVYLIDAIMEVVDEQPVQVLSTAILRENIDEQPVQVFGCWLHPGEVLSVGGFDPGAWRRRHIYGGFARCAGGCHAISTAILRENIEEHPDILEHVARDLVIRVSLAHAGLLDAR